MDKKSEKHEITHYGPGDVIAPELLKQRLKFYPSDFHVHAAETGPNKS
jgi:hypothetical protein